MEGRSITFTSLAWTAYLFSSEYYFSSQIFLRIFLLWKKNIRTRCILSSAEVEKFARQIGRKIVSTYGGCSNGQSNYYLLILIGNDNSNGTRSPTRRDRMLNNMGTFYKRAVRLSIGHGRNWKNAYVGQHRRYRRHEIMYFRNIAAFSLFLVSCLRGSGERMLEKEPWEKKTACSAWRKSSI